MTKRFASLNNMRKRVGRFIIATKKRKYILLVLVVLFISLGIAITRQQKVAAPGNSKNTDAVTFSTTKPSEIKPDKNTYQWKGVANDPKLIIMPTIGAEGFIQKVGTDQNKQVAVPNNIHLAGWFTDSVRPGDKGLSILDGHVDGVNTKEGVFGRIAKLAVNDLFGIELGDGKKLSYKVIAVASIDENKAAAVLFSQNPKIVSQLNMITCGGKFNRTTHSYDKRVIVSAELQS